MIDYYLIMFPVEFLGKWKDDLGRTIIIELKDDKPRVTFLNQNNKPYRTPIPFKKTKNLHGIWNEEKMTFITEAGVRKIGPTFNLHFVEIETGWEIQTGVSIGLYDDYRDDMGVPWAFPLAKFAQVA